MAKKKTRRRADAGQERDHLGCMWGFMNMFTFRHGPLSHKLLFEPKHVVLIVPSAAGSPRNNELDKSKCRDKGSEETHVGEEGNVTITIIKPSVKKLIAEELLIDKEIKKQREENAETGQLSDSELEGRRRKNHRRKNKTRKNSCGDFSHILNTAAESEEPKVNRRAKKGSERSLDIDNMVEEFCAELHRRSRAKNGMLNHKHGQEDYKEKLRELVKFLISQKLLHGENSEIILTSKDLMEVFQILGSDEDLFLKLLQDPEIFVPKSQKGEESLSLFERTQEGEKEASDRIFILKPRSASFSSLSPESHLMRNKIEKERNSSSHFFLSEIKRKLKQAIRKEQRERGFPKINVPSKDHFFFERMAKPSSKSQKNNEDDRMQKVSNIYAEAKKHLSEMLMLNNGDVDSNSTTRQFQNSSLGNILSLPDYLSPLSSPWEKSSPSHRKSASADFINAVSLPNHAMKNNDLPVCDLSKEPVISIESTEPTDKIVDIEDGTANTAANLPGSTDDVMIINEIDIVPEEAIHNLVGDLPKAEAHDEQRDSIISKQASDEERQPPVSSSVASPSHCLAKSEEECKSHVPEWSSPVSVLEPLFTEDDISPPKMRSQSDEEEAQVQPWCIHFDDNEYSVKTITSDKEVVFKYVRSVLDAVVSDFEELYLKAQFSDQLLEPALISNIPFSPNQLCHDHELLFDCINEVIMELCCCPPWASFVAPRTRVFSTVKSIVHEVQEVVYWHLLPLPLPHALDQIVRKDLAKSGNWLDIRYDIDCIGFETSELILEELLEELALNCLNNSEHSLVPAELKTDESILVL
ncbi:uncharacterized protein LOC106438591 isoform X1 [Brassica napus]|uniref:uncharacterized protein LOC106438591 isoform X1 n=1 Tax=Brassica napus TaxID=3708 RepID=UPI00207895FB|nr:uncharacterized protein LOC106438591 isoform X1 [Brassica napus]XP_013735263.2 uncharacterized protein LOC106438591 isoform X1 [Brassica napus]